MSFKISTNGKILELVPRTSSNLENVAKNWLDKVAEKRLLRSKDNECMLADIVTNYERVSDHCSNIAVCLIQEQDKEVEEHDLTAHMDEEDNRKFAEQIKEYTEKYALPEK